MDSLIKNDEHISNRINNMGPYRALRDRVNGLGYLRDEPLIPYLELDRFGSAALIRTFDLRYDLISTLVERWRSKTHTFHLSCGDCTVTLEDVALQLGFPIDGSVVTGISTISMLAALYYSLLGVSPNDAESKFTSLRFSWLKANFEHLLINAIELEVMCAAQAYIMHIIGGVLMSNTNNNRVHLTHLPLLTDLQNVRSYSWGFAILAMLYHELYRTTKPNAIDIGGCLVLLQSWALYRMSFMASMEYQSGYGGSYTILIYHLMTEQHAREGVSYSSIRDM
ncbi:hypothetical protein J1N35_034571 [Gossypium stocksii]|uniref:Aminotransferase-like plant mobile domain-containing protein n=1 Tax=Gossypium stocksii TaxID=47602 RepID=A0A9D3US98_9ROSI|nr:hypothetical protein J1N35_034571 [Gossypium stocksii]